MLVRDPFHYFSGPTAAYLACPGPAPLPSFLLPQIPHSNPALFVLLCDRLTYSIYLILIFRDDSNCHYRHRRTFQQPTMPPAKSSRNHDDSKLDAPNSKEKGGNGHTATKMRRNASQQNQSHLREVQNAAAVAPQPPAEAVPPSVGQPPPPYHDLQALFRSPVLLLAGDFTEVETI